MRRPPCIALLLSSTLLLVACGGGSGNSTGSTPAGASTTGSNSAEAAWTNEVQRVMANFENHVSAQANEEINTSTSQYRLEPMYAAYSANLATFAGQIEATDAPAACVATRKELAALVHKVGDLNGVLAHQRDLSPEEFSALRAQQQYKLSRVGGRFTALVADLHC